MIKLIDIATIVNGHWQGPPLGQDGVLTTVSIDSRTLQPGALFVAIPGPRFDGHHFLDAAKTQGAAAALVDHWVPECHLPQLIVSDTLRAMTQLAGYCRDLFTHPVAALT